jgi:hypothetical protein
MEHLLSRAHSIRKENVMATLYKKAGLICAVVATAAVFSAMPISLQRSAESGVVVSVDQAKAYYGHHRRVYRRTYRRHYYYHHRYRYY